MAYFTHQYMLNGTLWDIYYWLTFQLEETGDTPTLYAVLQRYKEYDRATIDRGLKLFTENYGRSVD